MFTYELNAKQMSKIYGDTKDEQEKLEIRIKEVLAGFKKADFEYLSWLFLTKTLMDVSKR